MDEEPKQYSSDDIVKELLRVCHHLSPELNAMWASQPPPPPEDTETKPPE